MEKVGRIGGVFVEILPDQPDEVTNRPRFVEAFVVGVEPRNCGPLVKHLSSKLPLANHEHLDLSHLKRVRRISVDDDCKRDGAEDEQSPDKADEAEQENAGKGSKRKRPTEHRLDVLLGAVSVLHQGGRDDCDEKARRMVFDKIDLSSYASPDLMTTVLVPTRQGESMEEWKEFNSIWPMTFFPNKTKEFQEQAMQLTDVEVEQMKLGMEAAIRDAVQCQKESSTSSTNTVQITDESSSSWSCTGAVVMSPETGRIVASASDERSLQRALLPDKCPLPNPLSTSIILAIQGVSRLERQAAISAGGMENENFRKGQYLCTGYDVYTTIEPTVYEAMALVHSRIRRLVFGCSSQDGVTKMKVHALPGTNHHYRAFMCAPESNLWTLCRNPNPPTGKR